MKFREFNKNLIHWYKSNYRRLPWRDINNPYKIWLSEIILQQTRVAQGLPYYEKFISKYPSLYDLASAEEDDVLRIWQGLGYYSRARNLLKCARAIQFDLQGSFPEEYDELIKLPGIGPYTAAAIASFAFKKRVAVVDGNVYRVLSRIFGIEHDLSSGSAHKYFKNFSEKFIPADQPDIYNQALMEFGATVCVPKNPKCSSCLFADFCFAYEHKAQSRLPVKSKKVKSRDRKFVYVLIYNENGCLMKKRASGDIWAEMYDFLWLDTADFSNLPEIIENVGMNNIIREAEVDYSPSTVKHVLSHQKLETSFLKIYMDNLSDHILLNDQHLNYYSWDAIVQLPKPVLVDNFLKRQGFID